MALQALKFKVCYQSIPRHTKVSSSKVQLGFGLDGFGLNGLKRPSLCADADDCQWTVVLQSCSACDEQAATGLKDALQR